MVIDNPFTDLAEAYQNRARIEKMRMAENIKLRHDGLSEFRDPHYPVRVRKPNYQHAPKNRKPKKPSDYQRQAHILFIPSEVLPYPANGER